MTHWVPSDEGRTAAYYRHFAVREVRGVSPSYEAICLGVADDGELLARIDTLPLPKRQPNLLLAGVRLLGGPVSSWAEFRDFARERWDDVAAVTATHRTQTNEPRRLTALLPVLAALPQPLALLEVGASAGLGLMPDRYAFRYDLPGGPRRIGDTTPVLACTATGPVPVPARLPEVAWRAGLDLNPLDVCSDADVAWLEALVWPEQTDRLALLRDAVRVARADAPRVVAGDLTRDLEDLAADAPPDATLVVFHSAVLAYVDDAGRAAFAAQLGRLRARRRVCWLANEAPGVVPGTGHVTDQQARFVVSRDGTPVALCAPHGQQVEWLA